MGVKACHRHASRIPRAHTIRASQERPTALFSYTPPWHAFPFFYRNSTYTLGHSSSSSSPTASERGNNLTLVLLSAAPSRGGRIFMLSPFRSQDRQRIKPSTRRTATFVLRDADLPSALTISGVFATCPTMGSPSESIPAELTTAKAFNAGPDSCGVHVSGLPARTFTRRRLSCGVYSSFSLLGILQTFASCSISGTLGPAFRSACP